MIKRPFFGLARPKLKYPVEDNRQIASLKEIPLPGKVSLFLKQPDVRNDNLSIKVGDKVRTGQKLSLMEGTEDYFISSVTGTIAGISQHTGYMGRTYTIVSIDVPGEDQWDDEFSSAGNVPTRENALRFLCSFPGAPDFASLLSFQHPVNTIVINGLDCDLLISTNQLIVNTEIESLTQGIGYLKQITKTSNLILLKTPDSIVSHAEKIGAEVKEVSPIYPYTLPKLIMKNVLGNVVLPGKSCEEMGVGFIKAEAVMALASAFTKGEIPVNKLVTVIDKDNTTVNVRVRIGTPIKDILKRLHIETDYGDRLVLGGPMTGNAIHSEDMPVMYDTDAIMVQDKDQIIGASDSQCVSCGECIRACPAKIPVNMLVRFLENGLYEEAAEQYDLLSCIECGICSYVCPARIPVFHYIMLGKTEFAQIRNVEEANA
jgi:electron transport complex protein RnfC